MKITRNQIETETGIITDVIVDLKVATKFQSGSYSYSGTISGTDSGGRRYTYQVHFSSKNNLRKMLTDLKAAS